MPALNPSTGLELPFFDGFPYWNTRLAPGIFHITLLPPVPEAMLLDATRLQARWNNLPVCLVLNEQNARCFVGDGRNMAIEPPCGGFLFANILQPGLRGDPSSQGFILRSLRLVTLINWQREGEFGLFGDLTKGGRPATADETARLQGAQPDGTPRGLQRCVRCGDWKGECLDPSEQFAGQVMTVHLPCWRSC